MKSKGNFRATLYVLDQNLKVSIYDVFDLPHTHVFCFCDSFVGHSVQEPEFQDVSVSCVVDTFVDKDRYLRRREGRQIMFHHIVTVISFLSP